MDGYGIMKAAAITGDVAMAPVPMYGIMLRLYLIYFLLWKEVYGILNFVKARVWRAIRHSEHSCPYDQQIMVFIRQLTDNWVVS